LQVKTASCFFFVLVVQATMCSIHLGKFVGQSQNRSHGEPEQNVEGFIGGVASATLLDSLMVGDALHPWASRGHVVAHNLMGLSVGW
jgi:CDP-diglyceride synthetase